MRIDISTPFIDAKKDAKILEFKRVMPAREVIPPQEPEMNPHEKEGDAYTNQLISFLEERKKRRKETLKAEAAKMQSEKYKMICGLAQTASEKHKGANLDIKV